MSAIALYKQHITREKKPTSHKVMYRQQLCGAISIFYLSFSISF